MNSIEIAEKLIEENDSDIKVLRSGEKTIRERIEKYKHDIESLQTFIADAEKDLQSVKDRKKALLVNNLALKSFIANGGGTDMLD